MRSIVNQGQLDHESGVYCQDVDETGSLLVTGTEEGQVVIWNVGSLYPIAEMRGKNSEEQFKQNAYCFHMIMQN